MFFSTVLRLLQHPSLRGNRNNTGESSNQANSGPSTPKGGSDFETAVTATGFGRFHYCLITISGLIYADSAIGVTVVSFVVPAATCDFAMSSADKGMLISAPMLGMVLGSFIWGCLADTKGRKMVLVSTLLIDGFFGVLSSIVQYMWIFMICRFMCGFAIAGAMGICFPYLGEFQQTEYRQKILCWMELFWTAGVILLPLMAWAIIPLTGVRIATGKFTFDTWNWFVAICAVPSILLGFWLFAFPESPKFMMECGDYDDALKCFRFMYRQNTGDAPENYPITSLKQNVDPHTGQKSVRYLSLIQRNDLRRLFHEIWGQTKALFIPPHRFNTILTSVIQFGMTTSYFTLMIWFPELFNRFEEYETKYPGQPAYMCDVANIALHEDVLFDTNNNCLSKIDEKVYINTLIVGAACIPTSLWLPLCVHRLGANFFLIFGMATAGIVTVALYFVRNSIQNLVLSCIFEALTSLAISLIFCVLVDMYPTHLRVMAAAVSATIGRCGGLLGNLFFGFLININCLVPIIVFAAFLFMAAGLCFLLPKTGEAALE